MLDNKYKIYYKYIYNQKLKEYIVIMKKYLKIFLSFLSLVALLFGSCKVGDKLGIVTQISQISGGGNRGENASNGLNTSLPIWNVSILLFPKNIGVNINI